MKYLPAIIFCIFFFSLGCQEEKIIQPVEKAAIVGNWQRISSKDNSQPIARTGLWLSPSPLHQEVTQGAQKAKTEQSR